MKFVLASQSIYRKKLLDQLKIPFITFSPSIDETPNSEESVQEMVQRLAINKASAAKINYPDHCIIASDQSVVLNKEQILHKPETFSVAQQQLKLLSGQTVTFYTSLVVMFPDNTKTTIIEPYTVHFRNLTQQEINYYLEVEKPYDCVGSFKSEGFGISLFSKLEGSDPNTLIGLPLIQLVTILKAHGYNILAPTSTI